MGSEENRVAPWTQINVNDSSQIPYTLDPEFHAHATAPALSGPGQTWLPQEREIVRKLIFRQRLQKFSSPEALAEFLPKGIDLGVEQRDALFSLVDESGPGHDQDITALESLDYLNAISSEEIRALTVPEGPSAVVGISKHPNESPEDPFGFISRLPQRRIQVFTV